MVSPFLLCKVRTGWQTEVFVCVCGGGGEGATETCMNECFGSLCSSTLFLRI